MPATSQRQGKKRSASGVIEQLTLAERCLIDSMVRQKKATATTALRLIHKKRAKNKVRLVEKGSVHRYVKGLAHKPNTIETRGRKPALSKQDIRTLDQTRRRLIKEANNDHRVIYSDVIEKAGLAGQASQRVCEDALRERGVGYKPPRRKIYITEEDAKVMETAGGAVKEQHTCFGDLKLKSVGSISAWRQMISSMLETIEKQQQARAQQKAQRARGTRDVVYKLVPSW